MRLTTKQSRKNRDLRRNSKERKERKKKCSPCVNVSTVGCREKGIDRTLASTLILTHPDATMNECCTESPDC